MNKKIDYDELRLILKSLPDEQKEKILSAFSKNGIDLSKPKGELTGTKIIGFHLGCTFHEAYTHKDIFLKLTGIILRKYRDDQEKIFQIKGPKRVYFSRSARDFPYGYERISGTDIYAGTNENAKTLNQRCQRVLQLYGIDPTALKIITN